MKGGMRYHPYAPVREGEEERELRACKSEGEQYKIKCSGECKVIKTWVIGSVNIKIEWEEEVSEEVGEWGMARESIRDIMGSVNGWNKVMSVWKWELSERGDQDQKEEEDETGKKEKKNRYVKIKEMENEKKPTKNKERKISEMNTITTIK